MGEQGRRLGAALERHDTSFFVLAVAVVGALFIAAFIAVTPAGFGLDEEHHTYRAWQVSRGVLEPHTLTEGTQYGGPVPTALVDYVAAGTDAANAARGSGSPWDRQDRRIAAELGSLGSQHPAPGEDSLEEFTNTGASSFVPYAPAGVGMRVATAAGADVAGIVTAGKVVSGAVYLALVVLACFSLRRSRWRWLTALVALLPLSIFQAAVLSADTFSNAVAVLFVALVLSLRESRGVSRWRLIALVVSSVLLVAAKPTYLLLLPLLLLVPHRAIGLRPAPSGFAKAGLIGALGALLLFLMSRVGAIADAIRFQVPDADSIDRGRQLELLIANPGEAFAVVARTFVQFGESWVAGGIAMFGTNIVTLPQPFLLALVIVLPLAALFAARRDPVPGVVFCGSALVTVCAIIGTLYLTFTPVGTPVADGVQGRYWIPILMPLAAGLAMLLPARLVMTRGAAWGLFGGVCLVALIASFVTWCWVLF